MARRHLRCYQFCNKDLYSISDNTPAIENSAEREIVGAKPAAVDLPTPARARGARAARASTAAHVATPQRFPA